MDLVTIIPLVFQMCILPLLAILTKYLVSWIEIKIGEMTEQKNDAQFTKYMTLLQDTVISCVIATNQTYVDTLKAQGKFDLEAQKVALQKTYDAVMAILTEDAIKYLNSVLGDFDAYVNTMIESQVNLQKVVVG
jgi:hypothetical protein